MASSGVELATELPSIVGVDEIESGGDVLLEPVCPVTASGCSG